MSARTADPRLVLGGEPRVQLLPQSVRAKERSARVRRRLVMLVVLALVVVGGGYAYAWMRNVTAQQQLETARLGTQAVLDAQAQYADGSRAAALVDGILVAQHGVTAHEISWDAVLDEVRALAPAGTSLDEANVVVQAPWEPALPIEGPLRAPRIATLTLTFLGPTIIDPVVLTTRLAQIEGYVDSRFDSSILAEGGYRTVVRLMLGSEAVSARFADPSGASTSEPAASPSATSQAGDQR